MGTYAGTSRQVAEKYINALQKEGLIKKTRLIGGKTKKFKPGTTIEMLDGQNTPQTEAEEPLVGYPTKYKEYKC